MANSSPLRDARRAIDLRIAEIAVRQHGVISQRQLLAIGLTEAQIRYRIKIGRLHRIHRGVYAVGHASLTRRGRWMAAVITCGSGSLLSHRPAGAAWGIAPYEGPMIDVTAPTHRRSRGRIRVHRGRIDPEYRTRVDGIPVTSVARTLLDLAEIVDVRRLERALERAETLDRFDLRAIDAVCERGRGHHGLANLRQALALHLPDLHTRSDLERDFAEICRAAGLPMPRLNAIVAGFEVDALWPQARLIVELDSWKHHRSRAAFEADRIRDAELKLAGYEVIRITWRRLERESEALAAMLRRLIGDRARAPGS